MYILFNTCALSKAFALTGRDCSNTRYPGCRFACPGLCATLGFQPALAKSETSVIHSLRAEKRAKLFYMDSFALSVIIFVMS